MAVRMTSTVRGASTVTDTIPEVADGRLLLGVMTATGES